MFADQWESRNRFLGRNADAGMRNRTVSLVENEKKNRKRKNKRKRRRKEALPSRRLAISWRTLTNGVGENVEAEVPDVPNDPSDPSSVSLDFHWSLGFRIDFRRLGGSSSSSSSSSLLLLLWTLLLVVVLLSGTFLCEFFFLFFKNILSVHVGFCCRIVSGRVFFSISH